MLRFQVHIFPFFFFFSLHVNSNLTWVHCSHTIHALKNIKNRSHGTIHIFKNYFATVLSIFSFNNNKLNPNGLILEVRHNFGSWKKEEWSLLPSICKRIFFIEAPILVLLKMEEEIQIPRLKLGSQG